MESAKVFVSLPFRVDGLKEEHPECLKSFDARQINRFLEALHKEILTVSKECDDLLVREIEIGNGSASHLTSDDLAGIVRSIHQHFHTDPHRTIRLTFTPSGFDFYKLSAVRQMKNATICFELPEPTDEGLRAAGYHCTAKQAFGALETCFQNAYHDFAVFLISKNSEAERAEKLLKRILETHPREIILRSDADQELSDAAEGVLAGEGWLQSDNHWYRDSVPSPSSCTVQVGCGPNAATVFDGIPVRSTSDFDFYCDHSDDFEALVKHTEA